MAILVTRDQELWGVALWVEKRHGRDGAQFIREQVRRLAENGDEAGIEMWRVVADRYDQLRERGTIN